MSTGASGVAAAVSRRYAYSVSGKPSATAGVLRWPIDKRVGARGRRIERGLELAPRRFERRGVGVRGHANELAGNTGATAEGKIDGGAVPVVELQPPPGGNGNRIDRPAGRARELDDAEPGHARDLGNVGAERDIVALLECAQHFLERAHAALADESAAVLAGPPNGADAEPLHGKRIDLAVAVPRHQHLAAIVRAFDERREKMLAVPHGDDDRRLPVEALVDAFRLDHEPGGVPYQTQVFRRHDPDGLLERARGHEMLGPRHRRRETSALGALIRLRIEQPV